MIKNAILSFLLVTIIAGWFGGVAYRYNSHGEPITLHDIYKQELVTKIQGVSSLQNSRSH